MKSLIKLALLVFTVTLGATLGLAIFYPAVDASFGETPTAMRVTPSPTSTEAPQSPTPSEVPTRLAQLEGNLVWEPTEGLAGYCDRLLIDGSHRAQIRTCDGEGHQASLDTDELRKYLTFLARYQPFALDVVDSEDAPGATRQRLVLAGRGMQSPTDAQVREIIEWAQAVFARLQEQAQRDRAIDAARRLVASQIGIPIDDMEIVHLEATVWRDACLELPEPRLACALVETPGYAIELAARGHSYRLHASEDGRVKLVPEASSTVVPWVPATLTPLPTNTRIPVPTPSSIPTPTAWPLQITEWRGEYWSNANLQGAPALVRNDSAVSFDWGYDAPASGLPADHLSTRWSRRVHFGTGTYRFSIRADDGVRLWVAGNLLVDRWHGGYTEDSVLQHIWEGEHQVVVEYFELEGIAKVHLAWQKQEPKPTPTLSSELWKAEYYERRRPGGEPKIVRNEERLDFDWGEGSPSRNLRVDEFSARFTRTITFAPGTYRLRVLADDGVRVWVDEHLVIDAWIDQTRSWHEATVSLEGQHLLRVDYYENTGGAALSFDWRRIGP